MKKILDNIKYLGVILALLFVASCDHELLEEYDSISVIGAPTLEITLAEVQDSTLNANYTVSAQGWLYVTVLKGKEDEVVTPTADQMRTQSIVIGDNAPFKTHIKIDEDGKRQGTVTVTGLKQDTEYVVFVMPGSVDGVDGAIVKASVKTSDIYPPALVTTSPAVASAADKAKDFAVTLTFDEPVLVNNADGFVFRYLNIVTFEFTDVVVGADLTAVAGNAITLKQSHVPVPGQYVFLSVSDDAVKDRAGNMFAGFTSGLSEAGALDGTFWRIAFTPAVAIKDDITPTVGEAQQDPEFDIVLTYDLPMDFKRGTGQVVVYNPKDVIIKYIQGGTTISVEVPADHIAFAGNVVTITQPRKAIFGETVVLVMKENALRTRYGSPSAEIADGAVSWLVSYGYTRDMIINDYVVSFVNHEGVPREATAAAKIMEGEDAADIRIADIARNYFGIAAEVAVDTLEGTFNGDFATIIIPDWQPLTSITLSGGQVGDVYFANRLGEDPVIGNIGADGSIVMDSWGWYFVATDESGVAGWVARFNTTSWAVQTANGKSGFAPLNDLKVEGGEYKRIRK
jgi:hypothetical protein